MAKFSIIIPVRNGGEYLKQAVQSVLAQTNTNFNLLILESGSTDGSIEYLQSIKDERVILHTISESLGIEDNWARILKVDRNEFMTILGQDDLLLPNYLETIDTLIAKHPNATLYQTHFNYIDAKGDFLRPCLPMDEIQYSHEFLAFHLAQIMDSMATGYMMRSKDYDTLGGIPHYPDLIFADYELWIKLTELNYKATSIKTAFAYRKHQSLSSTTKGNKYQQSFHRYVLFLKTLMERNEYFEQVIRRYAKQMLYYYCEKIGHRLLQTPRENKAMLVKDFIEQCKIYAVWLIPNEKFEPEKIAKINMAKLIDQNMLSKKLFLMLKKVGLK